MGRAAATEVGGTVFRVMAGPNGSIQGPAEAKWGYTTLNVADWDADGLPDIVFNSIWGRVEWLKNVGTRSAPRLDAPRAIEVEWDGPPPKPAWTWWTPQPKELVTQWRTTPVVHDFNGDGLLDLAMLDTEGYLAFFERVRRDGRLVLLPPRRAFCDAAGRAAAIQQQIRRRQRPPQAERRGLGRRRHTRPPAQLVQRRSLPGIGKPGRHVAVRTRRPTRRARTSKGTT